MDIVKKLRSYKRDRSGYAEYCHQAADEIERLRVNANRYNWIRDRMKVHYESPMSGGGKRATLTMRVGHGFLDSKIHPTTGWTDQKYFDECREKVDEEIDAAMKTDNADVTGGRRSSGGQTC